METFDINRAVVSLALARMVDSFGNSFLIIVLPLYIARGISGGFFGLEESLITGIVLSMFGFLNSFGQPFTGRLSDRLGRRKVFVLAGLSVLCIASFAYSFATSYTALLVIRAAQGVGAALTIPATVALIDEYATDTSRGSNMGVYNTFRLVGFGLGPVVAGSVVHLGPYHVSVLDGRYSISGFNAAFYIAAGAILTSFFVVAAFVEDSPQTEPTAEELSVSVFSDGRTTLDPVFTLALASLFMAVSIALLSTIEPHVNRRLHQTAAMFGVQFGAFVVAQVIFQTPIGHASDRYGRRPFIVIGMLLLVPATLVQGFITTSWGMVIARFAQGIAGAMVFAPALALAGDFALEGHSGTQLSLLTMTFGLGTALGPLTSGFLIRFGYPVPFVFGAALALVGTLLVVTQVYDPGKTSKETAVGEPSTPDD
ncbi:MFS transporter [Halocatena salina]|uniref:MFS transporter n=1 Tax=Halocatena salina TaxID=2934340 RepID=A0A8U0A1S7_9EURY|nr:MFS transporter [Halocatena salina]UPM43034.1 MFS transporter [Halocatena salina]